MNQVTTVTRDKELGQVRYSSLLHFTSMYQRILARLEICSAKHLADEQQSLPHVGVYYSSTSLRRSD